MIADWNRKLANGDSLRPIDPDKLRYVEACLEFMRSIDEAAVAAPPPVRQ